jgi:hypothetical protein
MEVTKKTWHPIEGDTTFAILTLLNMSTFQLTCQLVNLLTRQLVNQFLFGRHR